MQYASLIMLIARAMYPAIRPILLKAVDDPEAEWDDELMRMADVVFGWTGDK